MIRVNLLAKKVSKKKAGLMQHLAAGAGVLVVVAAAMAYVWFTQSSRLSSLRRQIAAQEQEKNRLKNVNEDKARYEKDIQEFQRKLDIITRLQKERIVPVHLLDELTKTVNSSLPVWLDKYTFFPDGIQMDGFSLSHEALRPFVDGLEKSPYYQNVELLYSERVTQGDREIFRFSIKAGVEQPAG